MIEEMKKFGYTKETLYTKSNRVKKTVKRHLFQSTKGDDEIWEEVDGLRVVYVTREIAEKMPTEIFMRSTFDDSRIIYETEEQMLKNENAIFGTMAPSYEEAAISHLIFEEELR